MDRAVFRSYIIEDRSYVAYIKREIHNEVKNYFSETKTGEIDIVVSEITSNIIKHANNGEILYRLELSDEGAIFEIIGLDSGPGIENVNYSIKDGISSKSTMGQGLGSIIRLSNLAQIYSIVNWGTIVYARFCNHQENTEERKRLLVRHLNVAKPGETVSGDGFSLVSNHMITKILVGDGLGHGVSAKEAMDVAISAFSKTTETAPSLQIVEIDRSVKKTRGLVGTIAVLHHQEKNWEICGVGNISTRMYRGLEYKNYMSYNGIIGLNISKRLESFKTNFEKHQQLIFCSDGVKTNWDLSKYTAIFKYDPIILAAAIYKDYARRTDDMTIVVAKAI